MSETGEYCRTCYGSNIGCRDCAEESIASRFMQDDVALLHRLAADAVAAAPKDGIGDATEFLQRAADATGLADRIAALFPAPGY